MIVDQLTRAEHIRLESFAQVNARHQLRPVELDEHLKGSEAVEAWIKQAREDA